MATRDGKHQVADRIVAMRLWLHRRLDKLYDRLCDPHFNGTIEIRISGKDGRPGEPEVLERTYGVSEL